MKTVLLSIQHKWCELIANGKKTVEIRKTEPKIKTPFRCYIYETKGKKIWKTIDLPPEQGGGCIDFEDHEGRGEVIGEFMCDKIFPISVEYSDPKSRIALKEFPWTCLTDKQIMDYLGNGKRGYGWHISDLVIYDKPKDLSEFYTVDENAVKECKHRYRTGQPESCTKHNGWIKGGYICMKTLEAEWCEKCIKKPLKKPPQSWCYVEELEG